MLAMISRSFKFVTLIVASCVMISCGGGGGGGSTTVNPTPTTIPVPKSVPLSANLWSNCAIDNNGGVQCWGYNSFGQSGNGSTSLSSIPAQVTGLVRDTAAVAVGLNHACALGKSNQVKCWGYNRYGQLGNQSTIVSLVPVDVIGLPADIIAIGAGGAHNCALSNDGSVFCWGANNFGQIGDGTSTDTSTPNKVAGLAANAIAIGVGADHSCALLVTGNIQCWGDNSTGQLGDNQVSGVQSLKPVSVAGLTNKAISIAASYTDTCAITTTGSTECWGTGGVNQATAVTGLKGSSVIVAAGSNHRCMVNSTGNLQCMGANSTGQLGDGSLNASTNPVDVVDLSGKIIAVAVGQDHSCALNDTGILKCWGSDQFGQVGWKSVNTSRPIAVPGILSGVSKFSSGYMHDCAVLESGAAYCWGDNAYGQLGNGSTTNINHAVPVFDTVGGFKTIAASPQHTCAVSKAGGAVCWGDNSSGQLGNSGVVNSDVPVNVTGLSSGVQSVAVGAMHSCALNQTGGVMCWGLNSLGQLGNSSNSSTTQPVSVTSISNGVSAVSAGYDHTCALTSAGGVKCWGSNQNGQLGNTSVKIYSNQPVDVTGLTSGVVAIATNQYYSCAVTNTGAAKCWGANYAGQLGNNSTTASGTPVDVFGMSSGVTDIATGQAHACVHTDTGNVECWGRNTWGQLGNGKFTDSSIPVTVNGLTGSILSVTAGGNYSCAQDGNHIIQCWGSRIGDYDVPTTNAVAPMRGDIWLMP